MADRMNVYDNYELEELEEFEETEKREKVPFEIKDLETANWALRKITAINKKVAENEALAEREHDRINSWLDKAVESDKRSILFFEGLLIRYFIKEKSKDDKFKISTPYGSVTSRKQPAKWEYDNTVIESLEKLGLNEFIKTETKKELKKSEIKKAFQAVNGKAVTKDGEIVEGITIIEQEEKINVTPAKPI